MHHHRTTLAAVLAALFALSISACGSSTEQDQAKSKPKPTATATATPDTTDTDGDGIIDSLDGDPYVASDDNAPTEDEDTAPTEDEDAPKQTYHTLGEWGQ